MNIRVNSVVGALVILTISGVPTLAAPHDNAAVQHFVCNKGYTQVVCNTEMAVLRRTVEKYPTAALGEWTWVLVQNEDWRPILKSLGYDPNVPAFSVLAKRETFIEEALVLGVISLRGVKLREVWRMPMENCWTSLCGTKWVMGFAARRTK